MEIWDWIRECREQYAAVGDENRKRLTEYWDRACRFRETDPDQGLALLSEGCLLAEELGERWWAIMHQHYRLDALMFWKQDYRLVVESAVRNSVAVSRSENAGFPGRCLVHRDLLSAYLGVDPVGYADEGRQLLAYLDREIAPEPNLARYLLLGNFRQFHTELGEFDLAEAAASRAQELLDRDPTPHQGQYSMTFHCAGLCWIAYRQEDWRKMAEYATLGEELARKTGLEAKVCAFLMWQAALARRDGDEHRAGRLSTTATTKMARLHIVPELEYPSALALFHELGGDLNKVLNVRNQQLAAIANRGRLGAECASHLERAKLLARMGLLQTEHLDAARQAARKLRKPEKPLSEIDKLTMSLP